MLNSLRTRLILIFVGLTILPLIVVGVLITQRGYDSLENQAIAFQNELAERTSVSLEAFFENRQTELFTLTNVYGLDTLERVEQRNILLTLLSQQPAYYQLVLAHADGNEIIRVTQGEVVIESDLSNRTGDPIFETAVETRNTSYGGVYFNEFARDRLVTMAVPIEDLYTGEIGNVLIAEVRFQNVSDTVLRNLALSDSQDVYILDTSGTVLAHRDPNLIINEVVFDLPSTSGRTTGISDTDVILASHAIQLANQELMVVAEEATASATALANDLSEISAVITLISLAVASVIVAWAANRVVRPIARMSSAVEAIQAGDFSARVSDKGKDEIAILGRAFNRMASELQKNLASLQQSITELEASNEERDKLIRELKAARRIAEENSRLKSEFLSMMSHELRTPMNAIEGFTSIMLNGLGGVEFNEPARVFVQRIQSNSKRLLALINDFLDLSRIESGRMELANSPFSPRELASRWEDEIGILADKKKLTFETYIDPTIPETLRGDAEAISKVAINLLSNAIKFTEEGRVNLSLERQGQHWRIVVKDTGIGIPPHAREFVFDEFRQVDQSSKRKYGGTGLGLAISQKIVRTMGGSISLESELGQGSTFFVTLPLQDSKEGELVNERNTA